MGFIDWLILAILIFFTIQGFVKGFIATLVRIGGAFVAFLLIGQIFPLVRNSLIINLHLGRVPSSILAVILLVIIILVLLRLIAWILTKVIKAMHLSFPNKLLGMIFGFANGLLIVIVFMVALDYFPKVTSPLKDGSKHRVYAAVDTFKEDIFTQLKFSERDRFHQISETLKEKEKKASSK